MAGNLGGLVVTLGLDAVQYFTGLNKAEQQAKKFADRLEKDIQKGAQLAQRSFIALTVAATAAALAIDKLIIDAGNFKDLEERTGASAEALAGFSVAASIAAVTSEDVANAMNKLAKNLTGVDDDSKAAGAALKALGIPIEEFKRLDPAKQIQVLAEQFNKFEDGAEKGAAAMALLGKSGALLLPFLKELSQGVGFSKILSQEDIERADAYSDAQKKVLAELKLYATVAAVEVIPAFTQIGKAVLGAVEALTGISSATDEVTRDKRLREFGREIGEWAKDAAILIGTVAEALLFLARTGRAVAGSFQVVFADLKAQKEQWSVDNLKLGSGKFPNPFDPDKRSAAERIKARDDAVSDAKKIADEVNKRYGDLVDVPADFITGPMRKQFAEGSAGAGESAGRLFSDRAYSAAQKNLKGKPKLQFGGAADKGGADKAEQEARRLLDVQLRAEERSIRLVQDSQRDQQAYLDAKYEDDLISTREYYAEKQRLAEDANAKILSAQRAQIEAAQAFANRPGLKGADKEAAQEKVETLIDKRNETESAFRLAASEAQRKLNRDAQEYADSLAEVNAQVLELAGNLEAAAAIRLERQQRGLRKLFVREGNTEGLAQLNKLSEQERLRARLNETTQEYGLIQQRLGTAQAAIDLQVRSGATTTLEAINKRSAVATKFAADLTAKADEAAAAIAKMVPGPAQDASIAVLERMRLEIEELKESAKELENTFRDVFEVAFADSLVSVVDGTKSVSDAFKDMERQIVAAITRIAAQNIAEKIFGSASPTSGIFSMLAGLFGGGAGAGAAAGGSIASDTLSFLGFAGGGSPPVGRPSIVGEKGPELFVPRAAGNIIPNSELTKRREQRTSNVSIVVNVPGSTSRTTADQVAVRTGAAVRRALARNT